MSRSAFPARRPEPEQCGKHLDFGHSCHSRGIPLALKPGRIWQRAHLFTTVRGLSARPSNEAVEMVDHEKSLGRRASRFAPIDFTLWLLTLFSFQSRFGSPSFCAFTTLP